MAKIEWHEAVSKISPHVVRISTPRGSGTGFLVSYALQTTICVIATAAHVVEHAHYWEDLIRFDHVSSEKSRIVRPTERAIFLDTSRDSAAVLFLREELPLPDEVLPLAPEGKFYKVGNDIGWIGFPAIPGASLCFFGGKVSAWLENQESYLVDGVAINGVSGGPAFHIADDSPMIMGVVSAYIPNRATGETLPGVSVVRSVNQFHELAAMFASLEQAKNEETKNNPPPESPPSAPPPEGEKGSVTE